jgi:hypothetical protein
MSHFVDQYRYKFDATTQTLFFSVCVTENRVIEHGIPVQDFLSMIQSYKEGIRFSSSYLNMKEISSSVILSIRENDLTRRSYNFSTNEFSLLISKFKRSVDVSLIEENLIFDPITSDDDTFVTQGHTFDIDILKDMSSTLGLVYQTIKSMEKKIDELEKKLNNNTIRNVSEVSEANSISSDMPLFIPNTVKTDFDGQVKTSVEESTDKAVQSATDLLGKMKKKKKTRGKKK